MIKVGDRICVKTSSEYDLDWDRATVGIDSEAPIFGGEIVVQGVGVVTAPYYTRLPMIAWYASDILNPQIICTNVACKLEETANSSNVDRAVHQLEAEDSHPTTRLADELYRTVISSVRVRDKEDLPQIVVVNPQLISSRGVEVNFKPPAIPNLVEVFPCENRAVPLYDVGLDDR